MEKVSSVLGVVLPVVVIFALGYFTKAKKIISRKGVSDMKTFVLNITLPVLIFGVFYQAEYTMDIVLCTVVTFGMCALGLVVGQLLYRAARPGEPLLGYFTTTFEVGLFGYALYATIFGAAHLGSIAMLDLGNALFVNTLYTSLLRARGEEKPGWKKNLASIFKTPLLLGVITGLVFGVSGLGRMIGESPAGGVVASVIDFIGAPTTCVILFAVGYEISISRRDLKSALLSAGLRLGVCAGLCALTLFILGNIMEVDSYLRWAVVMFFTLPPVCFLAAFTRTEQEGKYVSTSISLYMIITIAAFAVISTLAIV